MMDRAPHICGARGRRKIMTDHHAPTPAPFAALTQHRLSRREVIVRTALGASLAALAGVLAASSGSVVQTGSVSDLTPETITG